MGFSRQEYWSGLPFPSPVDNILSELWLRQNLCVEHTNCGKFLKRWEYQTTLPAPWEICMQVKKQQLEPDLEQWIGSKLRTEFGQGIHNKAVYRCSAYLTYMQSTSWEMLAWMKHKLESRLLGEI